MPPGRDSIQRVPIDILSAWEENELKGGRAGVYAWGVIAYEDIFGGRHITNVRLVCEGDGLAKGNMHACESGNDAT
jgi:hypothetical protein